MENDECDRDGYKAIGRPRPSQLLWHPKSIWTSMIGNNLLNQSATRDDVTNFVDAACSKQGVVVSGQFFMLTFWKLNLPSYFYLRLQIFEKTGSISGSVSKTGSVSVTPWKKCFFKALLVEIDYI